jgi:hypothetical protein
LLHAGIATCDVLGVTVTIVVECVELATVGLRHQHACTHTHTVTTSSALSAAPARRHHTPMKPLGTSTVHPSSCRPLNAAVSFGPDAGYQPVASSLTPQRPATVMPLTTIGLGCGQEERGHTRRAVVVDLARQVVELCHQPKTPRCRG